MEIRCEQDWRKVQAITRVTDGPERLLFGLSRFPQVSVDRLVVNNSAYADLKSRIDNITDKIGEIPFTSVFCRAGIYRSKVLAEALVDDNIILPSFTNVNRYNGEVIGSGIDFLELHGLTCEPWGFKFHPSDNRYTEALILAYSNDMELSGDRRAITQVAMMLDQGLQTGMELFNPLSVIWLDGDEDAIKGWFPDQ